MSKPIPVETAINLLAGGTSVKGDIKTNGDFRIDGTLHGTINSKGKIVVGASGIIEGEMICQNADISGNVKANIIVSELLSLKSTAVINGDLVTNKLSIEPGAKFTGTCRMDGGGIKAEKTILKNEESPAKEKVTG